MLIPVILLAITTITAITNDNTVFIGKVTVPIVCVEYFLPRLQVITVFEKEVLVLVVIGFYVVTVVL